MSIAFIASVASMALVAFIVAIAVGNKGDATLFSMVEGDGSIFTESINFVVSANIDQKDFSLACART